MTMFLSSRTRPRRVFCCALLLLAIGTAAPAAAQFKPRIVQETAVGDKFHIEGGFDFWMPTAELAVSSSGSDQLAGIPGTDINAKRDLGLVDRILPILNLGFKSAQKHKLRVQFIPIKYEQSAILARTIDFNGQRYSVGLPVNSTLDFKALRLGYEYDFVIKNRGFAGFIIEDKQTDVRVDLGTPLINPQFAHASAPVPALGGIGRYWILPRVNVTAEVTGFKIPDSVDDRYNAHYVDVDVYGTINASKNVGVKVGYRSLDMGYKFKEDAGAFTLKGMYVGVVARY